MEKTKNETITINKKMLVGIVPMMPIIGILLSKGQVGPLILFLMGIALGIYIGRVSIVNQKEQK